MLNVLPIFVYRQHSSTSEFASPELDVSSLSSELEPSTFSFTQEAVGIYGIAASGSWGFGSSLHTKRLGFYWGLRSHSARSHGANNYCRY